MESFGRLLRRAGRYGKLCTFMILGGERESYHHGLQKIVKNLMVTTGEKASKMRNSLPMELAGLIEGLKRAL